MNDDKIKYSILQGIAKAFGGLRSALFQNPPQRRATQANAKFTDAYRKKRRKKNRIARKSRRVNRMRCK